MKIAIVAILLVLALGAVYWAITSRGADDAIKLGGKPTAAQQRDIDAARAAGFSGAVTWGQPNAAPIMVGDAAGTPSHDALVRLAIAAGCDPISASLDPRKCIHDSFAAGRT